MPRKTLEIQFPAAGVIRRWGLRAAAAGRGPFPSPWATNVRLEDSLTERLRGGSFTGVSAGPAEDIVYRNRLITFEDNAIIASRIGDHTDTSLSTDVSDLKRPMVFQLSEAGEVGGNVIALIPHKDQFLLGFTADQTWVLAGDPTAGRLRNVSQEVGIIAARAWARNHDIIYFLSSRGIYSVAADGSGFQEVSDEKIPQELEDVVDANCVLNYNHADRGLYIHLPSADVSWMYDTGRDGFWPFDLDTTDSHVLIGPFRLGSENHFGRVLNLHGIIASGSADVTWRLVIGDTAEAAAANGKAAIEAALAGNDFSAYVESEGTWSAGRAHMAYPRSRAIWCCLWLASEGTWAYEGVAMGAMLSGKWR